MHTYSRMKIKKKRADRYVFEVRPKHSSKKAQTVFQFHNVRWNDMVTGGGDERRFCSFVSQEPKNRSCWAGSEQAEQHNLLRFLCFRPSLSQVNDSCEMGFNVVQPLGWAALTLCVVTACYLLCRKQGRTVIDLCVVVSHLLCISVIYGHSASYKRDQIKTIVIWTHN